MMHGVLVIVGSIVVLMLMTMLNTDQELSNQPRHLAPRITYQQMNQSLDKQNRQPCSGQQYVNPTQGQAMWDIENDAAHSGFQGNRPYRAPKFVAGLTAMSNDEI
jgi:hypothetical protein